MMSFVRHQKLRFAPKLHLARVEILGHPKPANLRGEFDPSVFLCDFDGTRKEVDKRGGSLIIIVAEDLDARGLHIFLVEAPQGRGVFQKIGLVPFLRSGNAVDGDGIIVALQGGSTAVAGQLFRGTHGECALPAHHHGQGLGLRVRLFYGLGFPARAEQPRAGEPNAFAKALIEIPALLALERAQVGQPVRLCLLDPRGTRQQLFGVLRIPLRDGLQPPGRISCRQERGEKQ
jgi:hypothetical protein